MKSVDLERLQAWVIQNGQEANSNSLSAQVQELRDVLGDIMRNVNEASVVFKSASRSPSPALSARASAVLGDVENFPRIKSTIAQVKQILEDKKTEVHYHPYRSSLLKIIDYLSRTGFTPEHIEHLKNATSATSQAGGSEFPDETNKEGLDAHLKNSIYNTSNPGDRTLKVVREILQNAVDATDPKTHPGLTSRQGFKPEIHVTTHEYKDYMDIMVQDKGVGMDWHVLSDKFFVTFNSGKSGDKGAAGGFGIAKALIQETPEHGWSIDTNGLHSNRFQKNVYFGSKRGSGYTTPTSSITEHGTTLSLHGLPKAYGFRIESLCEVYATNGRVEIHLNGKKVAPRFLLDSPDIKPMSDNLDEIPGLLSSSVSETETAKRMFSEVKGKMKDKLEDIGQFAEKNTSIKLFVRKTGSSDSGKLYVMVNGQYQFDEDKYINKLDMICSIQTTARPGSDEYPLDPGRGYVRGPVKEKIDQLVNMVKEFSGRLAEDDLFKQGIDSIVVNEDAEPMSVKDSESTTTKKEQMMLAVTTAVGEFEQGSSPEEKERAAEEITKKVREISGPSVVSDETIKAVIATAMSSGNKVDQKRRISEAIEGLVTPGHVLIQKNFVGRDIVSENLSLTGDMIILWQRALKIIIEKMAAINRYRDVAEKKFIPGVVFSNECLGLWMAAKPDSGRKYDSVSINPITISAAILPRLFREKMEENSESFKQSAFSDIQEQADSDDAKDSKSSSADTPTNRVSKLIYHIALHEICHLLYPDDKWSGSSKFHENITHLELVCHDEYEQIRSEVRAAMPRLRKSAQKLITLMSRSKKQTESFVFVSFSEWSMLRESRHIPKKNKSVIEQQKAELPKSFREFVTKPRT